MNHLTFAEEFFTIAVRKHNIMGVTKQTITPGNGVDRAKQGDTITMEYTGNLYDDGAPNKKGKQ